MRDEELKARLGIIDCGQRFIIIWNIIIIAMLLIYFGIFYSTIKAMDPRIFFRIPFGLFEIPFTIICYCFVSTLLRERKLIKQLRLLEVERR